MNMRKLAFVPLAVATVASIGLLAGCNNPPSDGSGSGTTSASASGSPAKSTSPDSASPSAGGAGSSAGAFASARKADGDVKIRVITNGVSPFWDSMGKGLDAVKGELQGADASWQAPQQADNNAQKKTFEDAIAGGADGIAVSPIQADAFSPVIDSAIGKGIPVITFDSDAPTSKRLLYIGTNNYEAGKRAGEAAVKLFPNGGKLVAFVGNMSAQNANDRYNGFKDAIKGKNIEFLQEPFTDDKDAGRARRNVSDAITKYGDKINGFVGLYSYNGPAIVDEVQKNKLRAKVKIICFDGEPKTLDNLGKGLVDATVVQKPYEFGRLSTRALYLINRKGLDAALAEMKPELEKAGMKVEGNVIDTGVDVIVPGEPATKFLKDLKEKGLEST
jgi:ribose transport system substrate-binding protein